jgi:hypothetical protein
LIQDVCTVVVSFGVEAIAMRSSYTELERLLCAHLI